MHLPIRNSFEFATFERKMNELTLGYSLARSMSYSIFRRSVLRYHIIGEPVKFKCILEHNHFISVDAGHAHLYRNVEDEDTEEDLREDEDSDDNPRIRKKSKVSRGSVVCQ
jgi:hypothetical protein